MKTLIKNGRLIDPGARRDGIYDVLIDGEMVARVAEHIDEDADTIIDAGNCFVVPGFVDLHVHLREPGFEYKETIRTGALAAARGGYTSICPMANTKPVTDSPERIQWLVDKANEDSVVHILPVGAVTLGMAGEELTDIAGMAKAGAVAISEDGKSVMNSRLYKEALMAAKKAGIVVLDHAEDSSLMGGAMNEGEVSKRLGIEGISTDAEDLITARDILLAKTTGAKLHICHCSTKTSAKLIEIAKANNISVTAEVCPHHFTLTDEDIKADDGNYKMSPPLRSKEDKAALIKALGNGTIDVISTDHAPHHADEKTKGIKAAAFGIVGLETALSLTMTELVHQGLLTPYEMVSRMSYKPAKIIGIDKGSLAVGKVADVTIIDPDLEYEIKASDFFSKGRNTPFEGYKAKGKVLKTIVSGKVVYENK